MTKVKNKTFVLILQHPQEPDKDLGTAKICERTLENCAIRTGLSWPNLKKALGPAAQALGELQNSQWLVFYLGGRDKGKEIRKDSEPGIIPLSKKGIPLEPSEAFGRLRGIRGIVLLDGTWSQAKAMWWRNPWLLKLQRAVFLPEQPSLYGKLRREPRRECLSTLETVAGALEQLDKTAESSGALIANFKVLLEKVRSGTQNLGEEITEESS